MDHLFLKVIMLAPPLNVLFFIFFLFANMYYINVTQKKRRQSPVVEVKPSVKKKRKETEVFL